MAPGADPAKRQQLALEVCTDFKKVLDGMRMYARGHSVIEGQVDKLKDHLSAYAATGENLTLGVTSLAFTFDDKPLQQVQKLEESLSHPLFVDGVQFFTLGGGCARPELVRLLELWRAALDGKVGASHTLVTRFWEADFQHFKVALGELLVEGGDKDDEDSRGRADLMEKLIARLSGEAAPPPDAQVFRGRSGNAGWPEQLKPLGADAARALVGELVGEHSRVVPRAVVALSSVAVNASAEDAPKLMTAVAQVLSSLTRSGRMGEVADLLRQLVGSARADSARMQERFTLLQSLFAALNQKAFVESVLLALDDEANAPHADAILRFLPAGAGQQLLDFLAVPKTPAGRKRLLAFIASTGPKPQALAAKLEKADAALAADLMQIAAGLDDAGKWVVRTAALTHAAAPVRKAALEGVPKEELVLKKALLFPLLADADGTVRRAVFTALVGLNDRKAVQPLVKLVMLPGLELGERKRAVVALGQLGGDEAGTALRRFFQDEKDVELRAAYALALGAAGDEKARPMLKEQAGKLLGDGKLKEACAEALKRLDAKKSGAKA